MAKVKTALVVILVFFILLTVACMVVFYQVPFDYDLSSIEPISTDVVLLSANDPLNKSGSPALAKIKDGAISSEDFRILFLTDVHLCELKDPTRRTIERMVQWIQAEKPDLIILGGDTLNGLNDRVRVEQFAELMDRLGLYWAPVLGNHEGDRPILMTSRKKVVEIWSKSPRCLMESDTKRTADGRIVDGYGNYVISVLGAEGTITNSFFFLDNGSKLMDKSDYEKWEVEKKADTAISSAQVTWYQETYQKMKAANGGTLTHMCVIHKPLQVMGEAIEITSKKISYGKTLEWRFVKDNWECVDGELRDEMHYPPYTDGDLYAALTANGAKAVFFGHDHVNSLTLYNVQDDIYLSYIRLTTVAENVPDAEGYNVMTVTAKGKYDYKAYKPDGSLDASLFNG